MISKDLFIETMRKLETLNSDMDGVDTAMKKLCPEFGGFYISEVFQVVMDIFVEMFDDVYEWLDYFAYEENFLHGPAPVTIWIDDQPVVIKNWGDVYDFLIKNMEGKL